MIRILSLSAGPQVQLSKNFRVEEFKCKDGSDLVLVADELIQRLQALREVLGKPVNINSAYRTVSHNHKIGGHKRSAHLAGLAADIKVAGLDPAEVAKAAEIMGFRGIGLYKDFVHVASRRSFWDKRSGKAVYVQTFGGKSPANADYKALYEAAQKKLEQIRKIVA